MRWWDFHQWYTCTRQHHDKYSHTVTRTHSLYLTLTHTHTLSLSLSHTHAHTHSLSREVDVDLHPSFFIFFIQAAITGTRKKLQKNYCCSLSHISFDCELAKHTWCILQLFESCLLIDADGWLTFPHKLSTWAYAVGSKWSRIPRFNHPQSFHYLWLFSFGETPRRNLEELKTKLCPHVDFAVATNNLQIRFFKV